MAKAWSVICRHRRGPASLWPVLIDSRRLQQRGLHRRRAVDGRAGWLARARSTVRQTVSEPVDEDGAGALVCRYGMREEDDPTPSARWTVLIAHLFEAAIENGHWRCEIFLGQSGRFQPGEESVDPVLLGINSAPLATKA